MVDISVHQHVDAPPEAVARVLFDAARDAEWIGGAKRVDVLGPLPYGVGTRVRRYGASLGRSFSWTTEITEFVPERLVRMTHISGPFTGGVDYSIEPNERGSEVTIRNFGKASFWFPFMAALMRTSVGRDLKRLQRIVEAHVSE